MKIQHTLLMLALSSVLVACGGGSDGNQKSLPNKPITEKPTDQKPIPSDNESKPNQDKNKTSAIILDPHARFSDTNFLTSYNKFILKGAGSNELNIININDELITLLPKSHTTGVFCSGLWGSSNVSFCNSTNWKSAITGREYKFTRFGYFNVLYSGSGGDRLFTQGFVTPEENMAMVKNEVVNGKATYLGDAFGNAGGANDIIGKSKIEVDFANKTLHGVLDQWKSNGKNSDDKAVVFEANIKGNAFDNEENEFEHRFDGYGPNGYGVKGKFFGPKAEEISGIISRWSDHYVFGGRRKK